jgi:pyruvate,orthophosphate dikinase
MEEALPQVYAELARVFDLLDAIIATLQDIELRGAGRLFMLLDALGLSAPPRRRSRIAVGHGRRGLITEKEAVRASHRRARSSASTRRSIRPRRAT